MKKKRIFATFLVSVLSIGLINIIPERINISHEKINAAEITGWNFEYTGSVEEFTAPYTGKYFLETWGAQGGGTVAGGGYTYGYINLNANDKLYICAGGSGSVSPANGSSEGGYNGGGKAYNGAGSGGGATHIATTNLGTLENYKNNKNEILLVAGGSGGKGSKMANNSLSITYSSDGKYQNIISKASAEEALNICGNGGGLSPDEWTATNTDNSGYAEHVFSTFYSSSVFANGEEGKNTNYYDGYPGAGGGGWQGGKINRGKGSNEFDGTYSTGILGGSGGQGYINNDIIYDYATVKGTKEDVGNIGNGHAKITYTGSVETKLIIDTKDHGTINGESGKITITSCAGESIDFPQIVTEKGYRVEKYKQIYGTLNADENGFISPDNLPITYEFTFEDTLIEANYVAKIGVDIIRRTETEYDLNITQPDENAKYYEVLESVDGGITWHDIPTQTSYESENATYSQKFNYTGGVQSYTVPEDGYYYIEATGASTICTHQNCRSVDFVKGGLSYGYRFLKKGQTIYVAVGGQGNSVMASNSRGGWNGGGNGHDHASRYNCGGGGATSWTLSLISDGQLSRYANKKEDVILVAGGSGGVLHAIYHGSANSGAGGGLTGGNGGSGAEGGTQSKGGSRAGFGYGGSYSSSRQDVGGGGGGWYGGGIATTDDGAGAGGSGYIGGVFNGQSIAGEAKNSSVQKTTYGTAYIYMSSKIYTDTCINNVHLSDIAAPNKPSNGKYEYIDGDKFKLSWKNNGDNGTDTKYKVNSYKLSMEETINPMQELLETSDIYDFHYTSGVKGFYYYIDSNSSGTITKDNTFIKDEELEIPVPLQTMHMHIATVDNSGNLSDTYTFEIPSVAKYTVKHYIQNEDNSYTLVETEEFMDTIGKTVTPEIHSQIGRDNPKKKSVVITADGKAVVEYYYDVTRYDISGTVQWNDHENEYGTRPSNVDVTIYRDGAEAGVTTVPAASTSNKYSFKNMQKYNLTTGALLNYTVSQSTAYSQAALVTTEDKYTTTNSGFDFLNTIKNTDLDKPENPSEGDKGFYLDGNIIWEDAGNKLGFRPDNVSIQLWQKGEADEFVKYREPIIVDADTENYYSFDWLPKYWYDENDIPTAYEYKTEEIFSAWYVQNGKMKDAYTINADMPDKFDFTNVLNIPNDPIIVVNQYENTLTVKTNTEEDVRIILKPLELNIGSSFNVSYGNETGEDTEVITNKEGNTVTSLPSTRYEVFVDSKEYDISDMELSLAENMELEEIDSKWYLTIHNQPEDSIGTLTINLTKKETYYQDTCRISNIYAHISGAAVEAILTNEISTFSLIAADAVTVEYINTDIEVQTYIIGDEVEIAAYVGEVPENMEFAGWAASENGEVEYMAGDVVVIENSIIMYPKFNEKEENKITEEQSQPEEQQSDGNLSNETKDIITSEQNDSITYVIQKDTIPE